MKKLVLIALFALSACSSATKFHGGSADFSAAGSGPNIEHNGEVWKDAQAKISEVAESVAK